MYTCIYVYMYICIYVNMYMMYMMYLMYTCIYIYVYMYICTYVYIYNWVTNPLTSQLLTGMLIQEPRKLRLSPAQKCFRTLKNMQHVQNMDELLILGDTVDGCEILHHKRMVETQAKSWDKPSINWGFGFLPSTVVINPLVISR